MWTHPTSIPLKISQQLSLQVSQSDHMYGNLVLLHSSANSPPLIKHLFSTSELDSPWACHFSASQFNTKGSSEHLQLVTCHYRHLTSSFTTFCGSDIWLMSSFTSFCGCDKPWICFTSTALFKTVPRTRSNVPVYWAPVTSSWEGMGRMDGYTPSHSGVVPTWFPSNTMGVGNEIWTEICRVIFCPNMKLALHIILPVHPVLNELRS